MKRLFFLLPLAVLFCACGSSENTDRPNVIVFIADDVSVDDLGIYGNKAVATPVIDSLGNKGIVFNNVFLTASSCSPSRASIISGRYPHNTGAPELHMPLKEGLPTMAGQLKNAGYYTGASGKWHLGPYARVHFDHIMDKNFGYGGEDRWLELIDSIPESQPYFLWMASMDAHRVWQPNKFEGAANMNKISIPPYMIQDSTTIADFGHYYDEISRFDYHIGESLNRLRTRGLLKNTLVIIMADNGRPFPRDKTRLYDSGIQTPFIVYWEDGNLTEGVTSNALVSGIDLAPTLVKLCGIEASETYQGVAFDHLLEHPRSTHRRYVFAEHNWHDYQAYERMIRSQEDLLITNAIPDKMMSSAGDVHSGAAFQQLVQHYTNETLDTLQKDHFLMPRPKLEYYRVHNDPYQLNNLADDPRYKTRIDSLLKILKHWQLVSGDDKPEPLTPDQTDFFTGQRHHPEIRFSDISREKIPGDATGAHQINFNDAMFQQE